MESRFERLGRRVYRYRGAVVVVWFLLFVIAGMGATRLTTVLVGGSGSIPGSQSERVDQKLERDFSNPFRRMLVVAVSSQRHLVSDAVYQRWLTDLKTTLIARPEVGKVTTCLDRAAQRLSSPDGHSTLVLIGLKAKDTADEERMVPVIRGAVRGVADRLRAGDPAALVAVTGNAAISYDITERSKIDGQEAEGKVFFLTLAILVFAFGALVAAGIPLVIGMVGTTVTLGGVFALGHAMTLSEMVQNMVTMIGLAVGIDYSLLMVSRFREARSTLDPADAVVSVVAKAGPAIVYSGLTVMVGVFGLFFVPHMQMRSIGIGGALVVAITLLAALTLLPALLGLLAPWLDSPRWLSSRMRPKGAGEAWRRLANFVMDRPVRVFLLATAVVLVIASPVVRSQSGFPTTHWFPKSMESRTALDIYDSFGNINALSPYYVIVRATDGKPILDPSHLAPLLRYARRLEADPRLDQVLSPVTLRKDLGLFQYAMLYSNLDLALARYPEIRELFLNRDRSAALFQLVPSKVLSIGQIQRLAKELAAQSVEAPLQVEVGGQPVYFNDFDAAFQHSVPVVVGVVIGITLLVLFGAFRSFLLPIKAVVMNLLSISAGYGAVVAVFHFGWLKELFGVAAVWDAIPLNIPITLFCVLFGLSMDYEVFLLTRIQEIYQETRDNRRATAEGLASTGGIITSAALVMIVVFGAFAMAEIAIIKMLGLGLAVSVLVDATLIRVLMVPSLMRLAGKWNWVPGDRGEPSSEQPMSHQSVGV